MRRLFPLQSMFSLSCCYTLFIDAASPARSIVKTLKFIGGFLRDSESLISNSLQDLLCICLKISQSEDST